MRLFPAAVAMLALASAPLPALDLWRHPEAADKNALFLNARFAGVSFADGFALNTGETSFDFLPFFLPLSIGAYFKMPEPNLKSFGARAAWHIDIRDAKTDLYFLYVFDCGFLRNSELEYYGDETQPLRLYDFRAGIRRLFGKFFCLVIETDYKFSGFGAGLSIKLN
jgi:hypothetical protein